MKKLIALLSIFVLVGTVFAANKTTAKTTTKTAAKKPIEMIVVESKDYAAGKQDPQTNAGLAAAFEGEPKVTAMDVESTLQDPQLANLDYSFLPLYLVKKTKENRAKVEPYIKAGAILETDSYLVFPHLTRTGVYTKKQVQPNVLDIFVMSQCPYGVMAENLIINAKKDGKFPADKTVRLRYIVNYNPETKEFQSLHGSAEWEEDVRQLLIAKYYPEKFWKYLEIRNKDYRSSRWDKAMEQAGINVNKILKKFDTEGLELLKAEAAYGAEYGINASPSFLWEGKEVLDFGSVAQKQGLEFLNPARGNNQAAAPAGSC